MHPPETASSQQRRFDVVAVGEAMLRLSVPEGRRLEEARALDMAVGGAESNVCVALAGLGWRASWFGRLPTGALGSVVVRSLRAAGVDVSSVQRAAGERMGTYFVEYAAPPGRIQVIYDRLDSAAARMTVADVPWHDVLDTRVLHLTGITAAISESCYAVVAEAVRRARAAGVLVSFDVNYRALLWDAAEAGGRLRPLIAEADFLMCKASDAVLLFGCRSEPRELLSDLQALTRARAIYCTLGERGAMALSGDDFAAEPALPAKILDRIGSGDAFAAGVLDAWLSAGDLRASGPAWHDGLRRGVALAALALSQYGDHLAVSRSDLEVIMGQPGQDIVR
jgi:2-dehydro-3-deoxygluconokinase